MVNILEEEMQWKQPKNKQEVRMKKLHYSESFHAKKNYDKNQIKVCRSIGSFKQIHVRPK